MVASFAYLPIVSPLHEEASIRGLLGDLDPALASVGGARADEHAVADPRPFACLLLTGGTEERVLEVWERRQAVSAGEPLLLVAHPGHNSLPAAMEVLARLHQIGAAGRLVYLQGPGDRTALEEVAEAVEDLEVRRSLRSSRIGLVGEPSSWLVASSPPADVVRRVWGPEVVHLDMGRILEAHRGGLTARARELALSVAARAAAPPAVATAAIDDAAALLPILEEVVAEERLDAVAVRCFDLISELGTSGCLALAFLNDAGSIAGCEGDVVSTVGMLWVRRLLGQVSWMANPVHVDVPGDLLRLAHCTVAPSLSTRYRLLSHFESGLGVGIQGDLAYDEVTLVRIGGADLRRLWLAEGRAVPSRPRADLCRTQLEVRVDRGSVEDLLVDPLGNHVLAVAGRHADRLRRWWHGFVRGDVRPG